MKPIRLKLKDSFDLLALTMVLTGCATTKSTEEIKPNEIQAVNESQLRVTEYKRAIGLLNQDHEAEKIGDKEWIAQTNKLNDLIQKEYALQDAITRKDSHLANEAQNLLDDIGNVAKYIPEVVGALALILLKALADSPDPDVSSPWSGGHRL